MRGALISVLLAGAAATAHAAPVTHVVADIDGDGAPDTIELMRDGTLRIETHAALPQTIALGRGADHAVMSAADVRGTPTIVVMIDDDAWVLEHHGAQWGVARREALGAGGLDRDYGYAIEATPAGLLRYQTRGDFHRCDGQPAYLFAEGWNGSKFGKLARVPTLVPDTAPVIVAHVDGAAAATPVLYQARVASHEPGAYDAGALGIPAELDDGKLSTTWHEELVRSDGEGQFFTFEPRAGGAKAAQIRIVPGNPQSAATLRASNRPRRIALVSAHGAWHIDLPDAVNDPLGTAYVADLPAPVSGCVSVVLESTYGATNGTTAIAELEVFAEGERSGGGEAMLATAIAEGKDTQSAGQELARRGAAGVAAIEAELGRATDETVRHRLARALIDMRDPAVGPLLARAVAQNWIGSADLIDAVGVLGTLGQTQELRELAGKDELALGVRVAAVHALAGKPELALELAGIGPRELRHAVIEIATLAPTAALVRAAQTATAAPAAGDLWRALTRRAHASASERLEALAAMVAALPAATDYERRYRLIDGIAAVGDAPALATLAALLKGLPRSAELAAFEQVAARAIAVNPRPEAFDLLVTFSRDLDPGVRLAALDALATAEAGAAAPWHPPDGAASVDNVMISALSTDAWPEVRRRAAQMLGGRCERTGPARALVDAVMRDHDGGVRGDSLAALVQCHAAGTGELLARLWDDGKAPIELRQRAIDLSVAFGDRTLGAKLVSKFASWRGAALESAEALALAQSAAYALGRLAPPGAAAALEAGLEDAGFPEIVSASATGLGLMARSCPHDAAESLRTLARSDDAQIATAAARAAAVCGR
jgi:hypothetical protein